MIIVVPCKVAIDEAGNRDGTQLDEAKKEEQVKTSFLPSAPRSGHFNHRKSSVFLKYLCEDGGGKDAFVGDMVILI